MFFQTRLKLTPIHIPQTTLHNNKRGQRLKLNIDCLFYIWIVLIMAVGLKLTYKVTIASIEDILVS